MDLCEAKQFYQDDMYGKECIAMAMRSNARQNFGAVVVRSGHIIGSGRNHRSSVEERQKMWGVDYAVHAEEAAIMSAGLVGGEVTPQTMYVIGRINSGVRSGELNIRQNAAEGYTCVRCAKKLAHYALDVAIPTLDGWRVVNHQDASTQAIDYKQQRLLRQFR